MPRARKYKTDADKIKAFRERHDLVPVTFDLPSDVVKGLNDYLRFKDQTKNAVMEKLIRSQLLRKR